MDAVRQELEDRAAAELAAINQRDQPGEINDMRPPV
jgi:hypothetical protein